MWRLEKTVVLTVALISDYAACALERIELSGNGAVVGTRLASKEVRLPAGDH